MGGPRSRKLRVGRWTLAMLSGLASLLVVELAGRLVGFDFERKADAFDATPIFYRRPHVALGDGLFRRDGPATWSGRVVTPMLERLGVDPALIPPEEPIVARYGPDGFRARGEAKPDAPATPIDWEVVVVGDSFTELGHLPEESLWTARAAELLGLRVVGLGVSHTGPLSHVAYLRRFGGSPSVRHAVLAFYEGNDLVDLMAEARAMAAAEARRSQGLPPEPPGWWRAQHTPQSSFGRAVLDLVLRRPEPLRVRHALFDPGGAKQPVSLFALPPRLVPGPVTEQLELALDAWAEGARELGARPWLLFLPSKRRVLHGLVRFEPDAPAPIRAWRPRGLIDQLRRRAEARGISFVDATPGLAEAARSGRLPYNPIWDSHPNRLGSARIAATLATALGSDEAPATPASGRDGAS